MAGTDVRKVLMLRGGALGDFIVTLPALALLRRRWPAAHLELVGNAPAAQLGLAAGCLDAAHSQLDARWAALYGDAPLPRELAAWLEAFDLVVSYWPDPAGELARRFPCRRGQTFLPAAAHPELAPAARHYCEPLRALGLETADFRSRLDGLAGQRDRTIAIHPGSGSPRKNWPAERWAELIELLNEPVLLVLGEAEREQFSRCGSLLAGDIRAESPASRLLHSKHVEFARNLPLPELAARLARCRLFLGHDSGVSHLAAAMGTPCLLLFGPTDPAMWAPPGDHVRVVRRGATLDSIRVSDVLSQTKRQVFLAQTGPA